MKTIKVRIVIFCVLLALILSGNSCLLLLIPVASQSKEFNDMGITGWVKGGYIDAVKNYIDKGNNLDIIGPSLLSIAIANNQQPVFGLLLNKKAPIKNDAFCTASRIGDLNSIQVLLNYKGDFNYKTDGPEPLCSSAEGNKIEAVKFWIEKGVDINSISSNRNYDYGYTPLMYAVINGNSEMVSLLLLNNADVNIITRYGNSALLLSLLGHQRSIYYKLKEFGAKIQPDVVLLRLTDGYLTVYSVDGYSIYGSNLRNSALGSKFLIINAGNHKVEASYYAQKGDGTALKTAISEGIKIEFNADSGNLYALNYSISTTNNNMVCNVVNLGYFIQTFNNDYYESISKFLL